MAISTTETKNLLEKIRSREGLNKTGLYRFVAEKLGLVDKQIFRWYAGIAIPHDDNEKNLRALADAKKAHVPVMLREPSPAYGGALAPVDPADIVRLPVFGSVPAGPPEDAIQEAIGHHPVARSMLKGNPKNCFILNIRGDSMAPDLQDGDMVVVNPNLQPLKGEVVVARVDGSFTCKIWTGDPAKLKPLNAAHKDVCAEHELQVVGVVVVEMKVNRVRKV